MRALWAIVVAGCWTGDPAPHARVAAAPQPIDLVMSETGFGPLDAATPATLATLRKLLVGYDVRPVNDESGLEYHVYAGKDELFYVVTSDEGLSIFNVHATNGRIGAQQHPWRVGQPFQDAAELTYCECWGKNPTCYRTGEHVAVNFNRECDGVAYEADRRALKVLDGLVPQRMIWSPTPFGPAGSASTAGDDDDDGN
jgi:hypothetical protein